MKSYDRARSDFEFLESIAELTDQVDLDSRREELMRDPTKATAAKMYVSGVQLWLQQHERNHADNSDVQRIAGEYA